MQQPNPFPLPVCIESFGPEPNKNCLPARMNLYFIGVFRLASQIFQCNQMIPDRNMLIVFSALYSALIEPFDPDSVNTERNESKESEMIRRNSSFSPRKIVGIFHGCKCRIRRGNILERFQPLQAGKNFFPRCRKYGRLTDDHTAASPFAYPLMIFLMCTLNTHVFFLSVYGFTKLR